MPAVRRVFPGPPAEEALVPCNYVSAEGLLDGDPQEREYLYLTTPDGGYTVGVWEAQPYSEKYDCYPVDEYCHVIRGQVTVVDQDGSSQIFTEGDSFVINAGWAGIWRVDEPFMKYFVLSVPRD